MRLAAAVLILCVACVETLQGQTGGVKAFPRIREVLTQTRDSLAEKRTNEDTIQLINQTLSASGGWLASWDLVVSEDEAITFWAPGTEARVHTLPRATLGATGRTGALFTELVSVSSGAWRFNMGTTLSVTTDESEENEGEEPVEEDPQTASGFDRFVAGGGNLSMGAVRPVLFRFGTYSSQFFYLVPRVWANVPGLGPVDDVTDFGGEIAIEYQYHRLAERGDDKPFLQLQVRSSWVSGTHDFYRTIGRNETKHFFYLVPSVSFIAGGIADLGVSTFIGPQDLERGKVQIHLTVRPKSETQ